MAAKRRVRANAPKYGGVESRARPLTDDEREAIRASREMLVRVELLQDDELSRFARAADSAIQFVVIDRSIREQDAESRASNRRYIRRALAWADRVNGVYPVALRADAVRSLLTSFLLAMTLKCGAGWERQHGAVGDFDWDDPGVDSRAMRAAVAEGPRDVVAAQAHFILNTSKEAWGVSCQLARAAFEARAVRLLTELDKDIRPEKREAEDYVTALLVAWGVKKTPARKWVQAALHPERKPARRRRDRMSSD